MSFLDALKPDDAETRAVALRETDPANVDQFLPFTKGPVVALLILACVGIAAVPLTLWRLVWRRLR